MLRQRAYASTWRSPTIALFLAPILFVAIPFDRARSQEPRPAPEKSGASSLARHVPLRDLVFYLECDGLDSHADAWRRSAACKLLNDTKLGAVVEDLLLQGIELLQLSLPGEKHIRAAELVDLLKQVARDGFAVAIAGRRQDDLGVIVVLRHGDRPQVRRLLEQADAAGHDGDDRASAPRRIERNGHTLYRLGERAFWIANNGDVVLTLKTQADQVVAVASGDQPTAAEHRLRATLAQADVGFSPVAIGWIDSAALALSELVPEVDGLGSIGLQWGFQDEALFTRLRVEAPAPRRGLLTLLDQPTFTMSTLPPVPDNLTHLTVLSIDLAKSFDAVDTYLRLANPQVPGDASNEGILARHGINLRRALLPHLGSKLAFYAQAPQTEDPLTPAALFASHCAGFTLAAQVRDELATASAVDSLIKSFNPILREQIRNSVRARMIPSLAFLKFAKAPGPRPLYVLTLPPDTLPEPYASALKPTVALGRNRLVMSASRGAAERALDDGPPWKPVGAFVPEATRLPREMVYLTLSDPRAATALFRRLLPILVRQITTEMAMSRGRSDVDPGKFVLRLDPESIPQAEDLNRLLFPSSTTVVVDHEGALLTHREAIPTLTSPLVAAVLAARVLMQVQSSLKISQRLRCGQNLQQIAIALRNHHHSAKNSFPLPATRDVDGKPLLSWRVAILPYLGQDDLFEKFRQNEPWDSPHNRPLLKEMPAIFACTGRSHAEPFTTPYRVFVGDGALFDEGRETRLADITDEVSQTIMIVESKESVPWTKPDELTFDRAAAPSFYGAGSPHAGGFFAAMANGAVRFIKNTADLDVFKALITRAAGDMVNAAAF
jgi:hypothetical protein